MKKTIKVLRLRNVCGKKRENENDSVLVEIIVIWQVNIDKYR